MLADLWTFKDKDIGPTMFFGEAGPVLVRRTHFFFGFPIGRTLHTKDPTCSSSPPPQASCSQ